MKDREFLIRSVSSIFIVAILLSFIYFFSFFGAFIFIFALGILMAFEWNEITKSAKNKTQISLIGLGYIALTLLPLLYLKLYMFGDHLLMWIFVLVWSVDTFAYIFGAKLKMGNHKITKISPKKSYEGLFAGMFFAVIFSYIFASLFLPEFRIMILCITPFLCILEQTSDILESYVKRKFNVKDSGTIIPGHGGVIDRFDGFMLPTIAVILIFELFI